MQRAEGVWVCYVFTQLSGREQLFRRARIQLILGATMNKKFLLLGLLLAGQLLVAITSLSVAHADIYQCNGKWTNRPCEGETQKVIKEVTREPSVDRMLSAPAEITSEENAPANSALEPLAPRTELVRKLRKQSDDYKRKGGVSLSNAQIDGFRRSCEDRSKPYTECLAAFNDQSGKLTALNQKQEELGIDQKRNEIEEDKVRAIRGR